MSNYNYITTTGVIVPDTSTLLSDVQTEFRTAFGQDLIVTPDTPQGVLITGETAARSSVVNNNAALANQINPNLAGGVFLDAICALTGLNRIAATPSTVTGTLTGVSGTIIPEGTRAQTTDNKVFATTGTVVIGVGGTIDASFQSVDLGPISCPAMSLTQIIDGILGWETVFNTDQGVLGANEQSDQSLRTLRKLTLALQGVALPEAIISGLYTVEGVKSLTFQENVEPDTQVINNIEMVGHSIYVCVDGGTDTDVATSLLQNKSLGCAWNGDTEVIITEAYSGQDYTVKFDRPEPVPISVRIYVVNTDPLVNAVTAVRAAMIDYVTGGIEGEPGFVVGEDVSAFELAGAVTTEYPSIFVKMCQISDDDYYTWSSIPIAIGVNEIATLNPSNIQVFVE